MCSKNKFKLVCISIKKIILPTIFCLFTISLVIFSKANMQAAKNGLSLWSNSVVPSLFPFFIATELLGYTGIVKFLGKFLNKLMRPLFNVPGEGAFALIMGFISGYPTGAKIVKNFREEGICTKEEGERLLAFTNNSGPLFIIGTVGISMLCDLQTGYLLLFTHFLAAISVGIIFRFWKYNSIKDNKIHGKKSNTDKKEVTFSTLGEVLQKSILSATSTIMMIGGFIVLFSVILSILENSNILSYLAQLLKPIFTTLNLPSDFIKGFLSGIIELTNGLKTISNVHTKNFSHLVIFSSFLLGFGGISVTLQVFSVISNTDISIKPYILGKLLQGSLASFYTYIALKNFSFLNLDLQTFSSSSTQVAKDINYSICFLLIMILLITITIFNYRKKDSMSNRN